MLGSIFDDKFSNDSAKFRIYGSTFKPDSSALSAEYARLSCKIANKFFADCRTVSLWSASSLIKLGSSIFSFISSNFLVKIGDFSDCASTLSIISLHNGIHFK
uniref:Uncharacterized protein n=1 Tax=Romanomermis culicivorax TaxID=13658 RepID=A0A915ICG1_ROMCU